MHYVLMCFWIGARSFVRISVSTSASHALEPGSIPGRSNAYTFFRLPEIVSGLFVLNNGTIVASQEKFKIKMKVSKKIVEMMAI